MAPRITIDLETLELMRSVLTNLPPKQKVAFNNQEAVEGLFAEIRKSTRLGYSFDDITKILASDIGVELNSKTLKSVFRKLEKANNEKRGKDRKRRPVPTLSAAPAIASTLTSDVPLATDTLPTGRAEYQSVERDSAAEGQHPRSEHLSVHAHRTE